MDSGRRETDEEKGWEGEGEGQRRRERERDREGGRGRGTEKEGERECNMKVCAIQHNSNVCV